jgi:CheY-like chemotaxis protein
MSSKIITQSEKRHVVSQPAIGALNVLVVDDSIPILKMMQFVLSHSGNRVRTAKDGVTAVELAKTNRFDMILLDIQLPRMSGLQAVTKIRANEAAAHSPRSLIIAMTANSKGSLRTECIAAGFDAFIAKPFTYEEIITLYRATLAELTELAAVSNSSRSIPSFSKKR